MGPNHSRDAKIERLISRVKDMLYRGAEKEAEMMDPMAPGAGIDSEKYERAREICLEILEIDPGNEDARRWLDTCDFMLRGYVPVQYMVPVDGGPFPGSPAADKVDALKGIDRPPGDASNDTGGDTGEINTPGTKGGSKLRTSRKPMPWDVLASWHARDAAGIRFTANIFAEDESKARLEIESIFEATLGGVQQESSAFDERVKSFASQVQALQARLNRGWKGHGPDVVTFARELFLKSFPSAFFPKLDREATN